MLRLDIEVPSRMDVQVRTGNGGLVRVVDVTGAVGIENSNAGVSVTGLVGPAAVTASNGGIEVVFATNRLNAPLSFITSNGPVLLTFPGQPAIDVELETDNGRVTSAFPVTSDPDARRPPGARMTTGRIGGGGALLRVRTDNGDIRLSRRGVSAP